MNGESLERRRGTAVSGKHQAKGTRLPNGKSLNASESIQSRLRRPHQNTRPCCLVSTVDGRPCLLLLPKLSHLERRNFDEKAPPWLLSCTSCIGMIDRRGRFCQWFRESETARRSELVFNICMPISARLSGKKLHFGAYQWPS